ncbi:SIR2 family protein [Martelella endophytica]|uniref:Uncharacterized protein n=1 Tax=Martelella endophytica TaxID=1486262 RepID=A0A0D5LTR5_MAREN|nr:SIR2 family protein [Martelella endophytica]AJY46768.1 hypothetical protein TM49_15585 [Martelella endophytica]
MRNQILDDILKGVADGEIVPYLGPGVLADVRGRETGEPMPADSDSLILAMNKGRPMAPKLMFEFPRAAMNIELKRGRRAVYQFLTNTYGQKNWTRGAVFDWLAQLKPPYIIDINRDLQLQQIYADTPHILIKGLARIGGTDFRYVLFHYDGGSYRQIDNHDADPSLPVLFKPMGLPEPDTGYIATDADYVDYITELMGGFAIPAFLKASRRGKRYLFCGMRFIRDTERMVMSDLIYDAGTPAGYALIANPSDKERRYCAKQNIEIVETDISEFLETEALVQS